MKKNRLFSTLTILSFATTPVVEARSAASVIEVGTIEGDATAALQDAINRAAAFGGKPVTIQLSPGNYDISRKGASEHLYHISNTASAEENPDQTKHIGLWMKDIKNLTIDGNGAWLVTHGEMTTFAIDHCEHITLKNFTLTSADPSVPEIKIMHVTPKTVTFEVVEPSRFVVEDGHFHFEGEGWIVADGGRLTNLPEYAQVFYPDRNVTLRCESPLKGYRNVRQLDERTVMMEYDNAPDVHVGESYQIRHGVRNEVCGFINLSKDIQLENIEFNFMGNFGLVGQYSENLTYDNIRCRPGLGSGRTDSGFADFVQMSGCRGKIRVMNSYFEGAHDDPINIHGTHLQGVESKAPAKLTVRFKHGQTYGFMPFFKGDKVEIVDRHTLNPLSAATLRDVRQLNDYDFELTFDRELPTLPEGYTVDDIAVENVTWTPEVEITNNYFARIPTRGILITTRGKSLIQDNIFYRIPMPSILVSDDARGWYESGPVKDLTIRRNTFIECTSPVIAIWPEIDRYDRPVHENILIEGNRFIMSGSTAVEARAVSGIRFINNIIVPDKSTESQSAEDYLKGENLTNLTVKDNQLAP